MRWTTVARQQAGVLTHAQAVEGGLTAGTVRRKTADGELIRLHPGVYLVAGNRLTDTARVWAAWLWAGQPVVVSGPAAAFWHGLLPRPGEPIELTVPRGRHPRPQPGLRVHRRDVASADRTRLRGLTVTGLALTVLQTAAHLADGSTFLDRALQQQVDLRDLRAAYHRNLGMYGVHTAGPMLAAAEVGGESVAERLLIGLLEDAGIGGWVLGLPFGAWRIDLAFEDAQVAVEVDGWAWHQQADRFHADRRKQNALVRAGWTVLRFTWHDLTTRPTAVIAEIRAALDRAA